MKVIQSVIELIGRTPLIDISSFLPAGHARLFAKLEMFNPGGSIKDRPALAMILDAEEKGLLKPGMTIVEPTAGNTGIGLALVGNLKGYRTVFFVPSRMSSEKVALMRLYGGEVKLVDKDLSMTECIQMAQDYAKEKGNCFVPQQFANPANPYQADTILGAEIREQLGYFPDGIAIGAGTGGTFSGLARWLRKNRPDGRCWLVQPVGSVFKGGERGCYQIEGIGNSFIPPNLDLSLADYIVDVPDADSFKRCKQAAHQFGLLIGGSSGANLEASVQLCRELGEGKTVVTIFADNIERYTSKPWVIALSKEDA